MVKKPTRIYTDIDMSFARHPMTGDIAIRADMNAVQQSLQNLMMTGYYERLFHPEIGTPISRLLFEPLDPITGHAIKQGIEKLIQNFEPRVVLISLDVTTNAQEDGYQISLSYYVRGVGTPVTYTTLLRRVR